MNSQQASQRTNGRQASPQPPSTPSAPAPALKPEPRACCPPAGALERHRRRQSHVRAVFRRSPDGERARMGPCVRRASFLACVLACVCVHVRAGVGGGGANATRGITAAGCACGGWPFKQQSGAMHGQRQQSLEPVAVAVVPGPRSALEAAGRGCTPPAGRLVLCLPCTPNPLPPFPPARATPRNPPPACVAAYLLQPPQSPAAPSPHTLTQALGPDP